METLTKLSARALEYYINARRWKSDLYFFDLEIDFLYKLIDKYSIGNSGKDGDNNLQNYHNKLSELIHEKHQLGALLDEELKDFELLAQDLLVENIEKLTGKHVYLEYVMVDWIHEYRKLKMALFNSINEILESNTTL